MTRLQEEKKLLANIDTLLDIAADIRKDIKRVNKHRHYHLLGKTDHHLRYNSISDHVKGLSMIMLRYVQDLREAYAEVDSSYDRLQTLYMWDDADADLETDAILSIQLVERERGVVFDE